jgi:Tfp pilus assembly pilus retraction ATPase PilT
MQSGGAAGMQTMDSALVALVESGVISPDEAYRQANNKAKFKNVADNLDDSLEEDA